MDSNLFMGLFIGAVLALLGGAAIIANIVVRPVIKLREEIVLLQSSIDNTKDWKDNVDRHLDKHDESIDNINKDITNIRLDLTQCRASNKPAANRRKAS